MEDKVLYHLLIEIRKLLTEIKDINEQCLSYTINNNNKNVEAHIRNLEFQIENVKDLHNL